MSLGARVMRLADGTLALLVNALRVSGATVGQALVAVSDGAGGTKFVPGEVAVPPLSGDDPEPLGTAAPGSTGEVSDAGHVHPMPDAEGVGAVRAATPSMASGTNWTASNTVGTADVDTVDESLHLTTNVVTVVGDCPRIQRDPTNDMPSAEIGAFEVYARVKSMSQANANARAYLGLAWSADPGGLNTHTSLVAVDMHLGPGKVSLDTGVSNGWSVFNRAMYVDASTGYLWVRVTQHGNIVSFWYGVGIGNATPGVWHLLNRQDGNAGQNPTQHDAVVVGLYAPAGGATDVRFDRLTMRSLCP